MWDNFIIGIAGAIGGLFMAIKNKLSLVLIVFSMVAGYFIAVLSVSIVDKYFPMADGDVKYAVGFFFGMTSTFVIQYYDDFLNFLYGKLKSRITKKTDKDEPKI